MNIAIVTFPRAINYGTALQAAALRCVLEREGHCVYFARHHCPAIEQSNRALDPARLYDWKYTAAHLANLPISLRRARRFRAFQQAYLPLTDRPLSAFHAVIAGSDQIWNPRLTSGDPYYFLPFKKGPVRKIAYAASFGLPEAEPPVDRLARRWLPDFNAVFVRERRAAELVQALTGQVPPVVADPTLLLTPRDWAAFGAKETRSPPYIFVYTVFRDPALWACAERLSARTGWPIFCIDYSILHRKKAVYFYTAGPSEWLYCLKNARYVCTNSYHGAAFSIGLEKPFTFTLPPPRSGVAQRLEDLTARYGLENRTPDTDPMRPIDFAPIRAQCARERLRSMAFLRGALHG